MVAVPEAAHKFDIWIMGACGLSGRCCMLQYRMPCNFEELSMFFESRGADTFAVRFAVVIADRQAPIRAPAVE